MTKLKANTSKVIKLPAEDKNKSERKWGKKVMKLGFNVLPSLLFEAQQRLGLNATQWAVLLHLTDFWWESERKPYPSKQLLSERLNLTPRHIQRIISELESAGLVQREARYSPNRGRTTNSYDLSGLVRRLGEFEPDFRIAKEEAKAARKRAATPIGKRDSRG